MKRSVALLLALGCARDWSEENGTPARAAGVLDIDAPIVARVGEEFVTGAELKRAFAADPVLGMLGSRREKAMREGSWDAAKEEEYLRRLEAGRRRAALQVMMKHLLAQEAARRGLLPSDADIERRLRRALRKLGDLKEYGYTIDELRADIRRTVLAEALERAERVGSASPPSPARIRSFYEEHKDKMLRPDCVRLRVIRIARTKEDPILGTIEVPEARRKAEKIAGQVALHPGSFARFAKEHSEDPERAERGGLLLYPSPLARTDLAPTDLVPRKALPRWLRDVVQKLQPGQTSPVVETPDSFCVIKLEAETPPDKLSFEDAQETVMNILRRRDGARAREEWARNIASRAVVTDGLGRLLDLESLYAQLEE